MFVATVESCREAGRSAGKRSLDPPLAKKEEEERENRPGRQGGACSAALWCIHLFPSAPAEDASCDDVPEVPLNGDRETLDETDESRKEEKNGFKAKFMFNIADGGFTGEVGVPDSAV